MRSFHNPNDGVWVTDFKTPPRQVFRGWVSLFTVDAHDNIFVLKGKPDLNGEVWKVKWGGSGLTRVPGTLPLMGNINYTLGGKPNRYFPRCPLHCFPVAGGAAGKYRDH